MTPRGISLCISAAIVFLVKHAAAQPMPGNVSLAAIRTDEKERDAREKLPDLIRALQLKAGSTVGDLGTGYGYYAARFSKVVGPKGRVFAEEIDGPLLNKVRERLRADRLENVMPVLGTPDDPHFPEASLDALIVADVYHEIEHPGILLSRVKSAMKPGARLVIVEYLKPQMRGRSRADQVKEHNIAPEFVESDLRQAGFTLVARRDPYCAGYDGIPTYFIVAER